ncbi:Stk1 family PASTA domain-containing Ser/Thr kinase [Paenibacillus sp. FSL H8-0457]|uniref:Stk1 family PASTA domain-containing Ser/Thr kinase n=1 Tax=Paenibacillus TaxID=44249 RepID=UPI0003E2B94F|nr:MULTISPECIES: Stk1 family PASTA domain-containing Ser/Thr kinase [Paenibacillus]ETT57185.1 serine/threonine protein kinase with PASTA sensor(s) [Paenibacillus sp. FSL H8-457]MCM3256562.1 Stk1 family PASTA domain-containing Ser/Thr kinase [Paenibacillus lautus]
MIGHELAGRYKIIERIGGGGMALVYKAQDILLNRNVAIKVLRQQFVHDEEFIRRFRREAQSAASLSHSNVVSIYDVGQEEDVHYIVMEYIEGQNLNEIIKERAPLQVEEAVRIATQICDALGHAHHNQIIHRDIKPHNILIGRNGRVKVTDFGIARAVTSTTITQTGSVVGSVHYFSPEHAKGVVTGEKSDLYSLGIVLYQMLTARLPFLGESPISVALKHLQEEFDEPREVNPLIPQSVENIILKSMRKNPEERYQSAEEMMDDLETCLMPMRLNEPKMEFEDDADSTLVMPALKTMQRSSQHHHDQDDDLDDDEFEEKPTGKPKKKWVKPTIIIGSVLLFLGLMLGVVMYVNNMLEVPEVKVPPVVGMTEEEAIRELEAQGLTVNEEVIREYKPNVDEGVVFAQDKEPETMLKKGSPVQLSVGDAKPLPEMPDLNGMTFDEAVAALKEIGVKETSIKRSSEKNDEVPQGKIFKQSPEASTKINPETEVISVTVSEGKNLVPMPGVVGLEQENAVNILESNGFKIAAIKERSSFEVKKGIVIEQWPHEANQQVAPGSDITLFVSSGYPSDALEYNYSVPVSPSAEGQESKIRVVFSDALGDNQEAVNKTITTSEMVPVKLLLAPDKHATVMIFRDGRQVDTYSVSYTDVKNGTVPQPTFEQPPEQPDVPVDTNPDEGNGEDGSNEEDDAAYHWDNGSEGNGKGKGKGKDND